MSKSRSHIIKWFAAFMQYQKFIDKIQKVFEVTSLVISIISIRVILFHLTD